MWHLIRLNNKKDKEAAMETLNASNLLFHTLQSLTEQHHTQAAIVNQLAKNAGQELFLVEDNGENKLNSFLSANKELFQKVRKKIGEAGHVQLSQEELDQFILVLQTPKNYKVISTEQLPDKELTKDIQVPYGPLEGLKGKYLNAKTPYGKKFYLTILSLFYIEIRIPAKDLRKTKRERSIEISYLFDNPIPQWYLLTSYKKEHLENVLNDTINEVESSAPETITTLTHPTTGQVLQTARYLFQATYQYTQKNGEVKTINLLPHHYFFKTTRYDLETFRNLGFDSHIYIMRKSDGSPITIPDKQMQTFIRFLKERSEATEVLCQDYEKGDVARIAMGIESSNEIEGTVEVVTKNHYILISENGFKINVRKNKNNTVHTHKKSAP